MLNPMVPLETPGDTGKVDFGGPGGHFFRFFGDFCPPLPTNSAPKIDQNRSFRFLVLLCMANGVVPPRTPGHAGKVDFGCPELFENLEKTKKNRKTRNSRTSEIDFSGVSGGPERYFWIVRPRNPPNLSLFEKKTHFWTDFRNRSIS